MHAERIDPLSCCKIRREHDLPEDPPTLQISPSESRCLLFSPQQTLGSPVCLRLGRNRDSLDGRQTQPGRRGIFTRRRSELPECLYDEDNRRRVPTNSCCSLPSNSASSWKNLKRGGGIKGKSRVGQGGLGWRKSRTISARKRGALVHPLLAVASGVAKGTLAHVAAAVVLLPALAAVEARLVGARQLAVLAVGALEARRARAHVAALQILPEGDRERQMLRFAVPPPANRGPRLHSDSRCISLRCDRGCCRTPASPART